MFREGSFQWEAMTLDQRLVSRDTAGIRADSLDTRSLLWFRVHGPATNRPVVSVGPGAEQDGIEVRAGEVRILRPERFDRIAFIRRKRFPLDMSSQPREIYIIRLGSGHDGLVVQVQPNMVRITKGEPRVEVA